MRIRPAMSCWCHDRPLICARGLNDARFSPGRTLVFDWSDVSGASTYTIQNDDAATFATPLT